jgi:rod shape-determining protein MreD
LQVFPLFVLAHAVVLVLRMVGGGAFPGFWGLLAPVLEALLWPLACWVLLAPQRRPPDRNENRPL